MNRKETRRAIWFAFLCSPAANAERALQGSPSASEAIL
jgi:hypothetical protein